MNKRWVFEDGSTILLTINENGFSCHNNPSRDGKGGTAQLVLRFMESELVLARVMRVPEGQERLREFCSAIDDIWIGSISGFTGVNSL